MMRYAFAFREWDFGGCKLDVLVNLNGIAVDDLAVEFECDLDTERALAGGRGPDDGDDWRFPYVRTHVREDSTRKIATAQMSMSNSSPPII